MKQPEFDRDGYPTEETLSAIQLWSSGRSYMQLLDFVMQAWHWPEYAEKVEEDENERTVYIFRTGGWSGNESLIGALRLNPVFWTLCWLESYRGGRHLFEVRRRREMQGTS